MEVMKMHCELKMEVMKKGEKLSSDLIDVKVIWSYIIIFSMLHSSFTTQTCHNFGRDENVCEYKMKWRIVNGFDKLDWNFKTNPLSVYRSHGKQFE